MGRKGKRSNGSRNKCVQLLLIFQKALREFFPGFGVILKHKNVLSFVYGLSNHPQDIIDLIIDRGTTSFAVAALRDYWDPNRDLDLFEPGRSEPERRHILYYMYEIIREVKAER